MKNICNKYNKNTLNKNLNKANSHKQISKIIKGQQPATFAAMRRNQDMGPGKPKGSFTTSFQEIDKILSETWKKITDGANGDPETIAAAFVEKYKKYICASE